jgi:hypothetical protein
MRAAQIKFSYVSGHLKEVLTGFRFRSEEAVKVMELHMLYLQAPFHCNVPGCTPNTDIMTAPTNISCCSNYNLTSATFYCPYCNP